MPSACVLEVQRNDLRQFRWTEFSSVAAGLTPGQVAVRVERFALTANNVTYGLLGERLRYWHFFPAEDGWGRIPAWGVGRVIASRHPDLPEGERLYGYLPMGSEGVLQPGRVGKAHVAEGSPHRATLDPAYNHYVRLPSGAGTPEDDNALCLLRPLAMTGLVAAAFFQDESAFGARRLLMASASSKTALATAFLLRRDNPRAPRLIGLTSPANVAFCQGTGYYDEIVTYPEVATLPQGEPAAFLDMAGNPGVRAAVHGRLAADLVYSGQVGWSHWDAGGDSGPLPGIAPTFFSSLEHIRRRATAWGPAGLEERFAAAWRAFVPAARGWVRIQHSTGRAAVEQAYRALLSGAARPEEGRVLSL